MMFSIHSSLIFSLVLWNSVAAFQLPATEQRPLRTLLHSTQSSTDLRSSIDQLKKVLAREYISFFNPMEDEYYSSDVSFQDPLTSLSGVDSYRSNVDMLSGRTLIGSILFNDASINLHSVTGGELTEGAGGDVAVSDITTRWTLRFCFQALPWKPVARFSGISVYKVRVGGSQGVQITKQQDYWDSINLQPDGSYAAVDKSVGLEDFVNQLKPGNLLAQAAAPELPFELLRRGKGYEVRRYPSFAAAQTAYERRDEGYSRLGSFCSGLNPLAPALVTVGADEKTMMWPLSFAEPGKDADTASIPTKEGMRVNVVSVPSQVVAVARFPSAIVEPVVRKATADLRQACERDGLSLAPSAEGVLQFCQYDAIFSMGERRSEVWIQLDDGHPWDFLERSK